MKIFQEWKNNASMIQILEEKLNDEFVLEN